MPIKIPRRRPAAPALPADMDLLEPATVNPARLDGYGRPIIADVTPEPEPVSTIKIKRKSAIELENSFPRIIPAGEGPEHSTSEETGEDDEPLAPGLKYLKPLYTDDAIQDLIAFRARSFQTPPAQVKRDLNAAMRAVLRQYPEPTGYLAQKLLATDRVKLTGPYALDHYMTIRALIQFHPIFIGKQDDKEKQLQAQERAERGDEPVYINVRNPDGSTKRKRLRVKN